MLAASTPRAATVSSAASITFLWALSLRDRGIDSDLYLRKQMIPDEEYQGSTHDEDPGIHRESVHRIGDQSRAEAVDPVCQRVQPHHHPQRHRQVAQRIERAR